tara:strand:- start:198 stop:1976 length:1779 start_codon:yes stop_codon:yes gene_type:complete
MSRIKVDRITDKAGTGAPILVNGMNVTGKSTMGDVVGAAVTFNSITGGLTGDVTGNLTGDVTGSGANLTNIPAGQLTGTVADARISTLTASKLTGALPAISGANLTGIESAPTIQAVANGAIAANKSVRVNEDGTISEIKNTNLSAATGSNTDIPHQYNPIVKAAVWISSTKFILFWIADDYSDRLQAAVGTASGTSITYGSRLQISTDTNVHRVSAVYDSSIDVVLLAYNTLNGAGYVKGLTVSGTTITVNATGQTNGDATNTCDIASDNKGGFIFCWVNTSQQWQVFAGTVTSAGAISKGSSINIANSRTIDNAYNTMRICYDKNSDAWVSICRFNNNTDFAVFTRSGTIVTKTSSSTPPTIISGTDNSNVNIVYFETEQRFLITSRSNSSPYGIKYATPKMNAGTTSLDTGGSGTWNEGAQDNTGYLAYDIGANKAFYIFANDTGGDTKFLTITLNASGTTSGTGSLISEQIASYKETVGLAVACNGEGLVLTGVDKSDDSDVNTRLKQLAVTVSNLKADNSFIGFSNAAISDSASGTVNVVGNITTQSGLTPSKKYYVQKDGTVSKGADDPSVVAGVALSSTTILIKG